MMKRKTIVGLAVAVGISVLTAGVALAESPTLRGYLFGKDVSTLTEAQKTDVQTYQEKLAQLNKEFYAKMVVDGVLTQAQADEAIARIDSDLSQGNLLNGLGESGRGRGGKGAMGGDMAMMDTSKLTDVQKADLKTITDKMLKNESGRLAKLVELKLLTQAQADAQQKVLTDMTADADADVGLWCRGVGIGPGTGEHGLFGVTLTAEQTAALTPFDTEETALRKEMFGKLVSFGVLTQAQADAILNMKAFGENGSMGMPGGMGGRGGRGGRGGHEGGRDFGEKGDLFDNGRNTTGAGISTPAL
jgi:hypothetical protein